MDVNKPQRSIPGVPNNTDRILIPKKRIRRTLRIIRILRKCKYSYIKKALSHYKKEEMNHE